jgi:hypothetical protein
MEMMGEGAPELHQWGSFVDLLRRVGVLSSRNVTKFILPGHVSAKGDAMLFQDGVLLW